MGKILIVDDEKGMQITLGSFLRNDGHEADTASNAREALDLVAANAYDVVVTDIVMPMMTGIELMESVRAINADTQIIIMTGEPTVETAIKAVQSGASDYLTKPIQKNDFLRSVNNVLKIKRLIDEKRVLELRNLEYQRGLEKTVHQRTLALQKSTRSVIQLLSQVVEFRDPYTAGHQRRVGNLSAEIAKKMNLDNDTIETVRVIGYIHDIGKIVIPAEILSKPGKLSEIEYMLLKTHSQGGYDMLKNADLPPIIAEAVYQHHERFNGSGYPLGLTGDQLKVESKILMVADVVEAMLSHRPYRPSLGQATALSEIEMYASTLYDPDVVHACLHLFRHDGYKIDDSQYDTFIPIQ